MLQHAPCGSCRLLRVTQGHPHLWQSINCFLFPRDHQWYQSEYGEYKSCTNHANNPSASTLSHCFQCLLYAVYGVFSHIDSRRSTFVHISTVLDYSYFSWTMKQSSHNSQSLFQALKLLLDRNFPFHGPALVTTLMNPKLWIYVWIRIPSSFLLVQSNEMISWRELWILHSTILYFQRKHYVRYTSCIRTEIFSERIHLVSDSPVARMSWIHRFSPPVNPPQFFARPRIQRLCRCFAVSSIVMQNWSIVMIRGVYRAYGPSTWNAELILRESFGIPVGWNDRITVSGKCRGPMRGKVGLKFK